MSSEAGTVRGLLETWAAQTPDAPALLAPGRAPLSYSRLLAQVDRTLATLHARGIGRGSRVACVLPNGPEMAAAFLSVAAGAVCAPLNPAYREAEFDFYLSDLEPQTIIVEREAASPAIAAAEARGIEILYLQPLEKEPAGSFSIEGPAEGPFEAAEAGDVALVLHTSGTTSRPKQVPLTGANLCHSARNVARALELTAADRCLNVMPLFHIHGLAAAVLASLASGASVVCAPAFYAPRFLEWRDEFEPTWYTAVPTMHQAILARAGGEARRSSLRLIRSSSAALAPQVMAELERVFSVPVIEAYGMTEAAHQMASNPLPPGQRKPGSVGRAAGPEIAIMDQAGGLLGPCQTGEIVIRGPNVTAGYASNPEANQNAFSGGWFRTGDQGRLDEEGYLFISGRTKEIINRGGEKISPREVDEALLEHAAVAQALAFAIPDTRLGEDVAAAVVLKPGAAATEAGLREFASRRLADFKVPRKIVLLDEIPKGPTGKPQRIGLAAKLGLDKPCEEARPVAEYVAPRTPSEELVGRLWCEVLGRERAGVRDNFLDLGGDSLLAAQLLARLAEAAGAAPPLLYLFENPTIEALAAWVDSNGKKPGEIPMAHDSSGMEPPLSFAQRRFWFLDQYEQDRSAYIHCAAFRLKGPLDVAALRRALDRIVERHEVVRTTYRMRGGVPYPVVEEPRPVELEIVEVGSLDEARALAAAQSRQRFDFTRDLMIRPTLARLAPDDHVLLYTRHHIASDGWSAEVFVRELAALYEGATVPDLPIQYSDYARWQQARYEAGAWDDQIEYWKRKLAGSPPLLPLPTDRPRPPRQTFAGGQETIVLPPELTAPLGELARREQATLFMALAAAFQALLCRYSGATDILVGCPAAGRSRIETEPLLGLFLNTLVLRTDLSGDPTFRELLARVRAMALGAYAHQELPFEKLVEALQPERSLSHSPLFQVFFQFRNLPFDALRFAGLECEPVEFDPRTAQFDLAVEVTPAGESLRVALTYNSDLFERQTARRMAGHYRALIEAVARDPAQPLSAIPLLQEEERRQVLVEWNRTERPVPPLCVHELFEAQAARTPDAVAVIFGDREIAYAGLNRRADALARRLRRLGVGPDVLVGLAVERSGEMVAALLGILKSGGAYLPLDPGYPHERLAFMLEDSGAPVLVTERKLVSRLPERLPRVVFLDEAEEAAGPPVAGQRPVPLDSLAYAIYTSGSTGVPKAVLVTHRSLTNTIESFRREPGMSERDLVLAATTLSFDIAAVEVFLPLICGARLAVAPPEAQKDGVALAHLIDRLRPTFLQRTPAGWRMLIDAGWRGNENLTILSGGEALARPLADALLDRGARVFNGYGPTEATIYATLEQVQRDTPGVAIGRPLANVRAYALDAHREPVPVGVAGELYIGGAGVARGYWKRPDLTAERFLPDPFAGTPGARMYKTGDLVRWLADGRIEYFGRLDDQVKVRGFRIELGEVEAALAAHPSLQAAAAAVREDTLVAYCRWRDGHAADAGALRAFLTARLPGFMVPTRFVAIASLPLLPSGKVDRSALAALDHPQAPRDGTAPRDETERRLAAIWEELLGTAPIGIDDRFFELGGHSLLAARAAARIEDAFGKRVALATLFEAPTIAQLAPLVRGETHAVWPPHIAPIQPSGTRPIFWVLGGAAPYLPLAEHLGPEQPVLGVLLEDGDAPRFAPPCGLETIAAEMVRLMRQQQPRGPYYLGGHSLHGLYALEAAQQLLAQREEVRLLILFDTYLPMAVRMECGFAVRARVQWAAFRRLIGRFRFREAWAFALKVTTDVATRPWRAPVARPSESIFDAQSAAAAGYRPRPYAGRILFLQARDEPVPHIASLLGWDKLAARGLDLRPVPGDHANFLDGAHAAAVAEALRAALAEAVAE
ncbi:MAG: amino acid adenylation domain-containing protein [Bryobacteraceae bacterium]|jgi:amino acid adenylation domain-containing protein